MSNSEIYEVTDQLSIECRIQKRCPIFGLKFDMGLNSCSDIVVNLRKRINDLFWSRKIINREN